MADLSQDELTVLLIAAKGESMMPIGRWEAPVASLVAKGYLHAQDEFNNIITDAGREAVKEADDANFRALIQANNKVMQAGQNAATRAEELAVLLAQLATYSSGVTGDDKVKALRGWAKVILERALELLK